jgi:hypothetical protein
VEGEIGNIMACCLWQRIRGSSRKCSRGDCRIKSTRWPSLSRTNRDSNLGVDCILSKALSVTLWVCLFWMNWICI